MSSPWGLHEDDGTLHREKLARVVGGMAYASRREYGRDGGRKLAMLLRICVILARMRLCVHAALGGEDLGYDAI